MIDDHRDAETIGPFDEGGERRFARPLDRDVQLQVPAAVFHARRHRQRGVDVEHLRIDEVEADAARAERVHRFQVGVAARGIGNDDGAQRDAFFRRVAQGIEQAAVVGAVDAGLHEHRALDAAGRHHGAVLGQRRRLRRVAATRVERVARGIAEDVQMRVAEALHRAPRPGTRKSKSQPSSACSTERWKSAA